MQNETKDRQKEPRLARNQNEKKDPFLTSEAWQKIESLTDFEKAQIQGCFSLKPYFATKVSRPPKKKMSTKDENIGHKDAES